MIIKSLARKQPTFAQLVAYCRREEDGAPAARSLFGSVIDYARRNGAARVVLSRNLGVAPDDRDAVIRAFENNFTLLPRRANGNALYHEVLSLTRTDGIAKERQVEMVRDIAAQYLKERAPNCLAYGVAHLDTLYTHVHLVISANEVGARTRYRLSRTQFAEAQRVAERYRLERYPELGRDTFYARDRGKDEKHRATEAALERRTGQPSRREQIKRRIEALCRSAVSEAALTAAFREAGLTLYCRGSTWGVQDGQSKRKFRLKTLGVETAFAEAQMRWSLIESREGELRAAGGRRPQQGRERTRGEEPPRA